MLGARVLHSRSVEIARRFKSQTLISADEIAFVDALEDGPLARDLREDAA